MTSRTRALYRSRRGPPGRRPGTSPGKGTVLGHGTMVTMPRSNRPRRRPSPPRTAREAVDRSEDREDFDPERVLAGFARLESAPDGEWRVRRVTTRSAAKDYTCPGCSRTIPPGTAHLVVWADDHLFGEAAGIAERRHWHTHCWRTRKYRFR